MGGEGGGVLVEEGGREEEGGFFGGFWGFLRFVTVTDGVEVEEGLPAGAGDEAEGEEGVI